MLSRGHNPTLVRSSITSNSLAVYDGLLDESVLALRLIAFYHAFQTP
jgi:hypothetical protein